MIMAETACWALSKILFAVWKIEGNAAKVMMIYFYFMEHMRGGYVLVLAV
jgi:hypothetical protein